MVTPVCGVGAPDDYTKTCELEHGHEGLHRCNQVLWHWPLLVLVGGEEPDLAVNTEHWVDGEVVLSSAEPAL